MRAVTPCHDPVPHQSGAPWQFAEAAAYLRVSRRTLERLADAGELRTVRIGQRRRLIPDVEVQRLAVQGCDASSE